MKSSKNKEMTIYDKFKEYNKVNRDIEVLAKLLVFVLFALSIKFSIHIYEREWDQVWKVFTPILSMLAVLTVAKVSTRLVSLNIIQKEDDRRQEIVQNTHHLMVIIKDLQSRVLHIKSLTRNEKIYAWTFSEQIRTIENRYEALLEKSVYRFLPGNGADIIKGLSGYIFGLRTLSLVGDKVDSKIKITELYPNISDKAFDEKIDKISNELDKLLDIVYEVREKLE